MRYKDYRLPVLVFVLFLIAHAACGQSTNRSRVAYDWLRQDKLSSNADDEAFRGTAKRVVVRAGKAIAYVKRAGADVSTFIADLNGLRGRLDKEGVQARELYYDAHELYRSIIFSHPSLDFDRILINVNPPTTYSHNGDQFLARHSRAGKGLAILSDWKSEDPKIVRFLEGKLPVGAYRDPDLSYDAKRVLFAFSDHTERNSKFRRFFIYEAALDGSWVKQITGTKSDQLKTWDGRATVLIEDNDPCYLPDGDIALLSTRSQTYGRCHGGRYNPAWVLYRCKADGSGMQQLSFGNENETEPAVLNDGRIIFTRWEYTDRHEMFFHKLWWCRPDGTSIAHFFGNDMIAPMRIVEATAIPGSSKVVATAQGHHSYNTGTIVVIDPDVADNGEEAITHITPETSYSETKGWPEPHYSHPYPVTGDLFLASRANHRVERQGRKPRRNDRGIYLVDSFGGRELIYEDLEMASFSPIAIRPRKVPPTLPPLVKSDASEEEYGTVFLQNAYLTRNDPEGKIKPGMIKALRINALGVQPRARRAGVSAFAGNNIPKKVLGTVPVNEDGSAFFKVPARTSLQVQTLDENGMAILTERSFFYLQPGERLSCIGCHEPYGSAPNVTIMGKARKMKPMDLEPPAGPQYPGGFSFMRTVQPVLDRHCISCHGLGESDDPKAKAVNLTNKQGGKGGYSGSYMTLAKYGDPRAGNKSSMGSLASNISRPRDFYAHRNKVSHMLLANHGNCNMDKDSYMRIIEWLDMNSVFYGDMFPNKLEDRRLAPEGSPPTAALRSYISECFGGQIAALPVHTLINKAQVDESRILMAPLAAKAGGWEQIEPAWASVDDPGYAKMAALVDSCILKSLSENTNGWKPSLQQGAGEKWVIEARKAFVDRTGETP
jgi:hypothetical protein